MAILNPDHLFEQAERLIAPPPAGPPRQVDIRRAISAAYYGVFHFLLAATADEFVGVTRRSDARYTLVYRNPDHRGLKDLCEEIRKQTLKPKYQRHAPTTGFGENIQAFAEAFIELQEKRHAADYDPSVRVRTSDALLAIATARTAVQRFQSTQATRRKAFLALVAFPPR